MDAIRQDPAVSRTKLTEACGMYQNGINLTKMSTYFGHKYIETTRIYLGISRGELAEAMAKRALVVPDSGSKYKN